MKQYTHYYLSLLQVSYGSIAIIFKNFKRYGIPKAQLVIADKFFECATNRVFKIIPKAEGDENEN